MSRRFPFVQVDAFTDTPLGGNPCAIVLDADGLDDETMLAIAREMNLSETSFVRRSEQCDVGARYFTPAEEIPMAGHPTIATAVALVETGRLALAGDVTRIRIELPVGPIEVEIHSIDGRIERVVMTQKTPEFSAVHDGAEVAAAFHLSESDLLEGYPVQTVSTGTPQLMIPVAGHAALRKARVDPERYERLRRDGGFFSPHLFCIGGATPAGHTFARHFGVPPDTMEDPFTGSATGGMAAYLWKYGLIESPTFVAEQGHWMGRPGTGYVEVIGSREAPRSVRVGGGGVTVLRGELIL